MSSKGITVEFSPSCRIVFVDDQISELVSATQTLAQISFPTN